MALRDQPYLPLYVQDYLTDEKLNMCSPASQGVYIKIMCVFHKSETYGGILLKQKDKQNESTCLNFALKFAKLLPFDLFIIKSALDELLEENVLQIDGDFLFQKRMVKDGNLSEIRALAGKKGGKNTQNHIKNFAKAKSKANTEDEYEDENENEINIEFDIFWNLYDKKVGDKDKIKKKWEKLKNNERQKIIEYIPEYIKSRPDKKFRKNPDTFLNQKSWNDEIIYNNAINEKNKSKAELQVERNMADLEARIDASEAEDS